MGALLVINNSPATWLSLAKNFGASIIHLDKEILTVDAQFLHTQHDHEYFEEISKFWSGHTSHIFNKVTLPCLAHVQDRGGLLLTQKAGSGRLTI